MDSTLTTKNITKYSDKVFIVMRLNGNANTGDIFQIKPTLSSSDPIVQNSFKDLSNFTVRVANRNLLIGNPEGKQPLLLSLNSSAASFQVQCNTPATIYWGLGIYPTILGMNMEDIQARLVDKNNGLLSSASDTYSWTREIYGLDYTQDFNVDKNISV